MAGIERSFEERLVLVERQAESEKASAKFKAIVNDLACAAKLIRSIETGMDEKGKILNFNDQDNRGLAEFADMKLKRASDSLEIYTDDLAPDLKRLITDCNDRLKKVQTM